ncbi:MAG: hypothetical protein HY902_20520 [Deltaproteobacteria bacterium]|nr:hypothetical protein [Deltaproteobacteria bacterium]
MRFAFVALVAAGLALGCLGCDALANYQTVTVGDPVAIDQSPSSHSGGPLLPSGEFNGWVKYTTVASTCPADYQGPATGLQRVHLTDDDGAIVLTTDGSAGSFPDQTGLATDKGADLHGLQLIGYKGETVECRGTTSIAIAPKAAKLRIREDMTSPSQLNCSTTIEVSVPRNL